MDGETQQAEGGQPTPTLAEASQKSQLSSKQVSELSMQNRANIAHFKDITSKIRLEKTRRDELNAKTKELRAKRREIIDKLRALREEFRKALDEIKESSAAPSEERLKAEIEALEWKLQTEDLNAKEEKELSKHIRELEKTLPFAVKKTESFNAVNELRKKLREAGEPLDALDMELRPMLSEANAHHEKILSYYKEAEHLSKSIRYTFTKLDMARAEANAERAKFEEELSKVREKEKAEREEMRRENEEQERALKQKVNEKAQGIYDEFKKGKKISTEEFLILQESGLL